VRDQLFVPEIARRRGSAHSTLKNYLRSVESDLRSARSASSIELDPYAEKLPGWLAAEAQNLGSRRPTLRQIHTKGKIRKPAHLQERRIYKKRGVKNL
jgi:hypothetical protein